MENMADSRINSTWGTLSSKGYLYIVLLALSTLCEHLARCQKATDAFQCPQQFGYFRDSSDCNRYFICVFGDALHDKCTSGLYFNDQLRMCDWPRNVKDCDAPSSLSKQESIPSRQTSSRPRSSGSRSNSIQSPNSISGSRVGSRYTPPLSVAETYAASLRNSTLYGRSHTRPYFYSTGPPASFKPQHYRVTTSTKPTRPSGPPPPKSSRTFEDEDYYSDEDDYENDDSSSHPLLVNQHLRNGNNLYVRPVSMPTTTTTTTSTTTTRRPAPSTHRSAAERPVLRAPPRSHLAAQNNNQLRTNYADASRGGSSSSEEDDRSYSRNVIVRPAAPTHGSNVRNSRGPHSNTPSHPSDSSQRLRPNSQPQQYHRTSVVVSSVPQSLDIRGRDSLDAQFGTNPRSISLPDRPYYSSNRPLNSFTDDSRTSDTRKAERSQYNRLEGNNNNNKPKVTSTRYSRPSYKTDDTSGGYDDYSEYYYDEDDYEDEDPVNPPKLVIRLQKPSSTTSTTTTTTTTTTTRRPPATTRRPATRPPPPKRGLPFGISRPATKSPIRTGPKPLPRLPSRPSSVYATPRPLSSTEKCSARNCYAPDCRCASAEVPGGLRAADVPQIVLITFDDAVNDLNYELYAEIFSPERLNPNGCPALGTFYVSHEWTDYGMVQSLYSKGHEMASHSITHSHGEKFSVSHWSKEITGQREILHLYGGVKLEDVRGMRAPFLQVGGNSMFEMLYRDNFTYDSSMPVLDNNPPFYPYTLDHTLGHECMIPPCPTKSFPGLWEVGMVMWNDYRGGRCSMGDACANPDNAEDVFKMLLKNFERHYNSNRAPFGLFYHAAWFTTQHYRKGYLKFLDHIGSLGDVYMVTTWQAIQWTRDPTPLSKIRSFEPWQCGRKDPDNPGPCHHPTSCNLNHKTGSRSLKSCQPFPSTFPWAGRTGFDEVYQL